MNELKRAYKFSKIDWIFINAIGVSSVKQF